MDLILSDKKDNRKDWEKKRDAWADRIEAARQEIKAVTSEVHVALDAGEYIMVNRRHFGRDSHLAADWTDNMRPWILEMSLPGEVKPSDADLSENPPPEEEDSGEGDQGEE